MTTNLELPIALRAFIEPPRRPRRTATTPGEAWPEAILVLDTETLVDETQRLRFGVYHYYFVTNVDGWLRLSLAEEGVIYDDQLPDHDPAGFAILQAYAERHRLVFLSRRAFVSGEMQPDGKQRPGRLWQAVVRSRAWLVCFNLPFDISRLAIAFGEARKSMRGGFSLTLFERYRADQDAWVPDPFRPRFTIKPLDSKRALNKLTTPYDPDPVDLVATDGHNHRFFGGNMVDLRTLTAALTDRGFTLEGACAAFGVPYTKSTVEHGAPLDDHYIDYCRKDVQATAELFVAAMGRLAAHPIDLRATDAYSAASLSKAYLAAFGIPPVLTRQPDFPREVLGYAGVAYYGGRVEAGIRRAAVPVRHLDVASMYATVCQLIGVWSLICAETIDPVDATDDVRSLLEEITAERCLEPATWRLLCCLVEIAPDGDIVPVRAPYTHAEHDELRRSGMPLSVPMPPHRIGINLLHTHGQAVWYTLADAIASTLLTGRPPWVVRAIRLMPRGWLDTLQTVEFAGRVPVDPDADYFRVLVEQRAHLAATHGALAQGLKTLANALYGLTAEAITEPRTLGMKAATVYGLDGAFEAGLDRMERLGIWNEPVGLELVSVLAPR